MITEDPQLEMRLRHYGSVLQDAARVDPDLHTGIIVRADRGVSVRHHRLATQLAVAAAMLLVAAGGVALMLRVRANELAKAEPGITTVSPADGAAGVPLSGEFRVLFANRPGTMPLFDPHAIPQADLDSLTRYVLYLRHPEDRGGQPLNRVGPLIEGFVAILDGLKQRAESHEA